MTSLKEKTKLNLWKNTDSVLKWFKDLENKNKLSFMQFDICDFYANITEDILIGALKYAKQHTTLTSDEAKIIFQTKKAFIFKDGNPGLGNTRGFYCNTNSGGSELQGIGQFLSPLEFYWKELIRT